MHTEILTNQDTEILTDKLQAEDDEIVYFKKKDDEIDMFEPVATAYRSPHTASVRMRQAGEEARPVAPASRLARVARRQVALLRPTGYPCAARL